MLFKDASGFRFADLAGAAPVRLAPNLEGLLAIEHASKEGAGSQGEIIYYIYGLCKPGAISPGPGSSTARGPNNSGFPTLQCSACHQTTNVAGGAVPGAPNWHLAPLSMGWEGLSDGALCRVLKDTRKNGGKSIDALVHHMTDDALVQWAWSPGGRVPPPLAQAEFHRVVRRWAETGAACPR
ncbi:MAG: hypothetical protein ABI541_08505 [Betaproteobacteria bacterium]